MFSCWKTPKYAFHWKKNKKGGFSASQSFYFHAHFCRDLAVGITGVENLGKHSLPAPWNMGGVWIHYCTTLIRILGACDKPNTEFRDLLLQTNPDPGGNREGWEAFVIPNWTTSISRKAVRRGGRNALKNPQNAKAQRQNPGNKHQRGTY